MPKTSAAKKPGLSNRLINVLYVCPFAHYPGHFSWAATRETAALKKKGVDVRLLTFCGAIDQEEVSVPHFTVLSQTIWGRFINRVFDAFRKNAITRWMTMSFETLLTLITAIKLKRRLGIEIIHLRDGEPYLFLPHILCLPFKHYRWLVSLTASNIYPPVERKGFRLLVYAIALKAVNSSMWRPLYKFSMKRNRFLFVVQNETAQADYSKYMRGIFEGRVNYLPLSASQAMKVIPKKEARKHLGIPLDKPMLLAFGAYHSGKDLITIFRALKNLPQVYFVHAGSQAFGLGISLEEVATEYIDVGTMFVRDYYVPESEKPYYFFAADAVILSYTRQFLSTSSLLWEACRFGLPVIASDNGQLKELMTVFQPGLLFSAQDPDSLREAVIRFINLEPGETKVLKRNCRQFAKEFSMERWAQKCLEMYGKLLASKN